jgi:transketolase
LSSTICEEIRRHIVALSYKAQSAHLGSSLSCVEILATAFSARENISSFRDCRIIMSKGHAAMALYATAIAFGKLDASFIDSYLKDGSTLWGHPSVDPNHSFIDWSTGSLGHGLPVAIGQAYAQKNLLKTNRRTIVVLSDGELDEGTNWEAVLFAGHHRLNHVTAIVDYNKIQSFGFCKDILDLEPLRAKFEAFNWDCVEVDGHHETQLTEFLQSAPLRSKPLMIIAHTVKGKGLAEIENTLESHYKPATEQAFERTRKGT